MSETVRDTIVRRVLGLRAAKGLTALEIRDDMPLMDGGLGLESLDLAQLIAELELDFGADPFSAGNVTFRTFGDLVALYSRSIGSATP